MNKEKVIITILIIVSIPLSFILGKITYWNKEKPTLYINNNHKKTEIYNVPGDFAYITSYTYEKDQSTYLKNKYKIKEKEIDYLKSEIKFTIELIENANNSSIEFDYKDITIDDYMIDKTTKKYVYIEYYDVENKTLYIFYQNKEKQKD